MNLIETRNKETARTRSRAGGGAARALGTLSYILLNVAQRRTAEISGVVWGLGVVFVIYFYVTSRLM